MYPADSDLWIRDMESHKEIAAQASIYAKSSGKNYSWRIAEGPENIRVDQREDRSEGCHTENM